jgi:hypothetical protein
MDEYGNEPNHIRFTMYGLCNLRMGKLACQDTVPSASGFKKLSPCHFDIKQAYAYCKRNFDPTSLTS